MDYAVMDYLYATIRYMVLYKELGGTKIAHINIYSSLEICDFREINSMTIYVFQMTIYIPDKFVIQQCIKLYRPSKWFSFTLYMTPICVTLKSIMRVDGHFLIWRLLIDHGFWPTGSAAAASQSDALIKNCNNQLNFFQLMHCLSAYLWYIDYLWLKYKYENLCFTNNSRLHHFRQILLLVSRLGFISINNPYIIWKCIPLAMGVRHTLKRN